MKEETGKANCPFPPDKLDKLKNSRVISKEIVYVVGLSENLAFNENLWKDEFFGQYGKVVRIVINHKAYDVDNLNGPCYSAFVTYSQASEASIAILALNNSYVDHHRIKASFGTSKYCSYFLNGQKCCRNNCLFIHKIVRDKDMIIKEALDQNNFVEFQLKAIEIADIYNIDVRNKLVKEALSNAILPSTDKVYRNWVVMNHEPFLNDSVNSTNNRFNNNIKNENDNKEGKEKNNIKAPINNRSTSIGNSANVIMKKSSGKTGKTEYLIEHPKDSLRNASTSSEKKDALNKLEMEALNNSLLNINSINVCTSISTADEIMSPMSKGFGHDLGRSRYEFVDQSKYSDESDVPEYIYAVVEDWMKMFPFLKRIKNFDSVIAKEALEKTQKEEKEMESKEKNAEDRLIVEKSEKKDDWNNVLEEFVEDEVKPPLIENIPITITDTYVNDFEKIMGFVVNRSNADALL
ncbi:MAG: hypothetical protein MJ252_19755 [archaeon]|nr:hypothetical protein [archaeon]